MTASDEDGRRRVEFKMHPRQRDNETVVVCLADVIDELPRYKGLDERYHRWSDVVDVCRSLALRLGGAG